MPVHTIVGPKGEEYDVETPEGATKEQAFEFFKRQYAAGNLKPTREAQAASGPTKKAYEAVANTSLGTSEDFMSSLKGAGAAVGDFASGLLKIPASAALAVGHKIISPSTNLQQNYENAQQAVEDTFPSFGKGMKGNIGYDVPMYPFEKYGQGVGYVAKKAGEALGPDVEGAINIGANFLPIPFAGKAHSLVSKGLAAVDPTLRKPSTPVMNKAAALEEAMKPPVEPINSPETIYTDSNGVSRTAPPDAGELAARAAQDRARQAQYQGQMELPLENSAQHVAEMQARAGAQRDLFAPVNQEVQGRLPPVSPDNVRPPIPDEAQGHLPFDTSLEDVARTQRAADPQLDLFSNERPSDVPYSAQEAQRQAQSVEQLQRLNREGTQQHIVEDFGNNDPMERMPNMRVDENGMPIRADLSMEAQNLENPLQRNIWGDELGPALDQTRSLTDAIDSMPPGRARDAAISNMSGVPAPKRVVPRSQRGSFDFEILPKRFRDFVEKWNAAGGNFTHTGVDRMLDDMPVSLDATQRKTLEALYPEVARQHQSRIDKAWAEGDIELAQRRGKAYDNALLAEAVLKHVDAFGKGFKPEGQRYDSKNGFYAGVIAAHEQKDALLNSFKIPKGQRGAIDATVFEDLYNFGKSVIRGADGKLLPLYHGTETEFKDIKESTKGGALGNGVYLAVRPEYASSYAEGNGGNVHQVYANITNPLTIKGPGDPMVNALVALGKTREQANKIVEKAYDDKGYITNEVRSLAKKAGYDGLVQYRGDKPSEVVAFSRGQVKNAISPEPVKPKRLMTEQDISGDWEAEPDPYAPPPLSFGGRVPSSQSGKIDFSAFSDAIDKIKSLTSKDPAVQAAAKAAEVVAKQERVKAILGSKSGYVENVRSPEDVLALAEKARDIPKTAALGAKSVTPGINTLAIKNPNPLVKYMRYKANDIFHSVNALVEQHIKGEDGIGTTYNKLSGKEIAEVVQAIMLGDKKQMKITPEHLDKAGFSENQKKFIQQYREMDAKKLEVWNDNLQKTGMPPVAEREGHAPGIFGGDYRQLVLGKDAKGNYTVPLYHIGTDFGWQLKAAQTAARESLAKQGHTDVKFTNVERSKLGGSGVKGKDFGSIMDTLNLLAQHDPEIAAVKKDVEALIAQNSDRAYGAAYNALQKKGIGGSYGKDSRLTPEENGRAFVKAYLRHWEEQMVSHMSLPLEQEMRGLMDNPVLTDDKFGNAKQYVNDYLRNMTGRSVGETGTALNKLLDAAPRKLSEVTGHKLGFGPSTLRSIVSNYNAALGRKTEGFMNVQFSAVQLLQALSSGLPEVAHMAGELKAPSNQVYNSFITTLVKGLKSAVMDSSPQFKADMTEAKARGLLTFSEFNDVDKVTQSKLRRGLTDAADFNRNQMGERPTRPLVFLAAVDVLRKQGLEGSVLYDTAYNATQAGMFSYEQRERPMMYGNLGVTGQLMGKLTTYKHNYVAQGNRFIQGAVKDGNVAGIVPYVLVGLAFSGIKGLPAYQDIDQVIKYFTNNQSSLKELALHHIDKSSTLQDESFWSGVLSTETGLNFQSRLSSADLLPNSIPELVSPYFSDIGKMAGGVKDAVNYGTNDAKYNAAINFLPTSLKGFAREALITDEQGFQRDAKSRLGDMRSDKDRTIEKWTGTKGLNQALTSENRFNSSERAKSQDDQRKALADKAAVLILGGKWNDQIAAQIAQDYVTMGGDPMEYQRAVLKQVEAGKMEKDTRTKGIPSNNLRTIRRYQLHENDKVTGY